MEVLPITIESNTHPKKFNHTLPLHHIFEEVHKESNKY